MLRKFLQDYFSYQLSHILGGRKYTDWAEQTLTLQKNIPIKNKKLAKELEEACAKKGFLTYSEFLTIDQFGKYGYHHNHANNGMTDVRTRWPAALAALCNTKNIHHIVEFGPGDGILGALTLEQARKINKILYWSGVEISEKLQEKTKQLFREKGLEKQLKQLVSSIDQLSFSEKCLFLFSYSLDNLLPEVFINTSEVTAFPNAMLGVTVQNGLLSEIILTEKEIKQTGCSLKNGVYTDPDGFIWNLQEWQLAYMQRLYVHIQAFKAMYEALKIIPTGSHMLIIDEFYKSTQKNTYHYGIPKDLEIYARDMVHFRKYYATAGSHLLYFPLFYDSTLSFFSQLRIPLEENSSEHQLAYALAHKEALHPKNPKTFALLTSPQKTIISKKKFIFSGPSAMIQPPVPVA